MTADDAVAALGRRFSVGPKHLAAPGPDAAALQRAAEAAARTPDHEQLHPWRLVVVPAERRAELGDLFARDAQARGADPQRARERAFGGPVLVALVAHVEDGRADVPAHEQWMTAGGALTVFLSALHLLGFAGKALSGSAVQGDAVRAAFEQPGERLVCWIALGTPTRGAHPRVPESGEAPSGWQPIAFWG
jgi:nitroreductase